MDVVLRNSLFGQMRRLEIKVMVHVLVRGFIRRLGAEKVAIRGLVKGFHVDYVQTREAVSTEDEGGVEVLDDNKEGDTRVWNYVSKYL